MNAAKEEIEPVLGYTDLDELIASSISFPDLARKLKFSIEALHRHRIAGRIPAFRVGKTYYTTNAAVMDFLRAGSAPGAKSSAANPANAGGLTSVPSRLRRKQIQKAMLEAERLGC